MTIGGMRISEVQFKALCRIMKERRVVAGLNGFGGVINRKTAQSLVLLGLIETFVPGATTYAMAARGRVRYYRLTNAGFATVRGLKKLYKQRPVVKVSPAIPVRRVRQRIVDT